MKNIFIKLFLIGLLFVNVAQATVTSWWPTQKKPDYILRCVLSNSNDTREMNLAQSLAGLAAQGVNDGSGNEGLWIETHSADYQLYYKKWVKRLEVKELGAMPVWEIVERYKKQGYVKGYILYDYDKKDNSINLATVQAGLLKGILVDITQEDKAKKMGLKKLYNTINKDITSCLFNEYKSQLNNNFIVLINPEIANNRDYVIAHKGMVYYGVNDLLDTILEWVCPLSPVIGWNSGPEFQHIAPCSNWGLINTASDWCMNLTMLSVAGNEKIKKLKSVNPAKLTWKSNVIYHSFVMSDGDNMQWTMGSFINKSDYWSNEYNSEIPMTFTTCMVNLSMAAPDVLSVLMETQPKHVSLLEYGGGYYYPDLFASKRPNREELLRNFARIVSGHLQRIGLKVFGFICNDLDSKESLEAYRIFAEELEDIVGMIAVQYVPYNGGYGKTFWMKDRKGNDIPVLSARNQIWANEKEKRSGTPSMIAANINEDVVNRTIEGDIAWTIVHAWSCFEKKSNGEIICTAEKKRSSRGVTPAYWCKRLLNEKVQVVPIDELLWRIRMKHNLK
ncbi:hypothetical protein [Bacteroides difficilis]|uniref:hypothetical protein n=1 Tax=Bacteroides difficilis TaxID=2763021 RepID=UPI003AADD0C9